MDIERSNYELRIEERKVFYSRADEPFEYRHYQVNFDGVIYLPQQVMVDRNNWLFDSWNIIKGQHEICRSSWSVGVQVRMTAKIGGIERSIDQYGANKITVKKNQTEPTNDDLEQAIKSAISDGMKKCSSWLGVGSHVYRGEVKAILPNRCKDKIARNREYNYFIQALGLDEGDHYHGLAVLPDSFRKFYEEKGWTGLFRSDVRTFRNQLSGPQKGAMTDSKKMTTGTWGNQYNGTKQLGSKPQKGTNFEEGKISTAKVRLLKEIASEIKPSVTDHEIVSWINSKLQLRITDLNAINNSDYQKIYQYLKDTKKSLKEKSKTA